MFASSGRVCCCTFEPGKARPGNWMLRRFFGNELRGIPSTQSTHQHSYLFGELLILLLHMGRIGHRMQNDTFDP